MQKNVPTTKQMLLKNEIINISVTALDCMLCVNAMRSYFVSSGLLTSALLPLLCGVVGVVYVWYKVTKWPISLTAPVNE